MESLLSEAFGLPQLATEKLTGNSFYSFKHHYNKNMTYLKYTVEICKEIFQRVMAEPTKQVLIKQGIGNSIMILHFIK